MTKKRKPKNPIHFTIATRPKPDTPTLQVGQLIWVQPRDKRRKPDLYRIVDTTAR